MVTNTKIKDLRLKVGKTKRHRNDNKNDRDKLMD